MYGLYDREGILRYINEDKNACIAYAELFEINYTNYCLMDLTPKANPALTNLDLNQAANSN